jgi:hypothetical protein
MKTARNLQRSKATRVVLLTYEPRGNWGGGGGGERKSLVALNRDIGGASVVNLVPSYLGFYEDKAPTVPVPKQNEINWRLKCKSPHRDVNGKSDT